MVRPSLLVRFASTHNMCYVNFTGGKVWKSPLGGCADPLILPSWIGPALAPGSSNEQRASSSARPLGSASIRSQCRIREIGFHASCDG